MQILLTFATVIIWDALFFFITRLYSYLNLKLWILAFAIYFIPAFYLPVIQDVGLFETVGIKLLERVDFYAFDGPNHGTFPFLPFMNWFYAISHVLSKETDLPFIFFVRLLMIAAVFGTTILIGKLNRVKGVKKDQLFFLFNPVNLLVFSLHGQADILLIFFTLFSVFFFTSKKKSAFKSAVLMAISVLIKTWSIIFIPLFLIKLKNFPQIVTWLLTLIFIIGLTTSLYVKLFHSSFSLITETLNSHVVGAAGFWGYTGLLNLISKLIPSASLLINTLERNAIYSLIIAFGVIYFVIIKKHTPLLTSMVIFLLTFKLVSPGWGLQYTAWILPFAVASGMSKDFKTYSLLAILYLSLSYLLAVPSSQLQHQFLIFTSIALGLIVWIYVIYWLFQLIKKKY